MVGQAELPTCATGECAMRQGNCCDLQCVAGGGGVGGGNCAFGDDCGGQVRTECGTNCPPKCGEPAAGFCIFSCFVGFQCPVRALSPSLSAAFAHDTN